jgi:mannose-6-phosphate isomerase-like protein (cupin superfamily)
MFCDRGYARDVPFGCVDQGLLSVLYFLPGQAMAPHRHLDSDEYFTALTGDVEMLVNGRRIPLRAGQTFLRRRGVLHALRNPGSTPVVVQSFQVPIPRCERIVWEECPGWTTVGSCCTRCWCGQQINGRCLNCDADWDERSKGA